MSTYRGTIHSIQFLRFVAATLVVIFHAHMGFVTRLTGGSSALEDYLFEFGAVGVHVFFVISGYIMYLVNVARTRSFSAADFFTRRLIRIYPAYWIFVALYLAVEAALAIAPALTPRQFAGMVMLWPADASRVIGPAWTLSFEMYFYLVFGIIMPLGARRGVWILSLFFLAAVTTGVLLRPMSPAAGLATNTLLLEFLAGVWIARITTERSLPRAAGILAVSAGLCGFALSIATGFERHPTGITLGVPSALLVAGVVILEQRSARAHPLLLRLSKLGDSSYTLYLCHILIVTISIALFTSLSRVPDRFLLTAVVALACIVFAILFYRWIERRSRRRSTDGCGEPNSAKPSATNETLIFPNPLGRTLLP